VPQVRLFLSRVIKLLINATLSLPQPRFSSTFPFYNNAASHLFVNIVFSYCIKAFYLQ